MSTEASAATSDFRMFPSRPRRSVVICLPSSPRKSAELECEESCPAPPPQCPAAVLSMGSVEELRDVVLKQERIIHDLRQVVTLRDEEILQLRSQLDKFQSVLIPYNRYSRSGRRKERAQGISAEPQSLRSIQDLIQTKFQDYPKSDRSVDRFTLLRTGGFFFGAADAACLFSFYFLREPHFCTLVSLRSLCRACQGRSPSWLAATKAATAVSA